MRTNIVIDDDLLAEAMKYSSGRCKRAVVKEALATYVTVKAEQQRLATYRDRLTTIRRRVTEGAPRTPVMQILKVDRDRPQ